MTKLREPASFEAAVLRCLGVLLEDGAAQATGKSGSLLRQWSDPDNERRPSVHDALALDQAMRRAGAGAPIFDVYRARLLQARAADGEDLSDLLRLVMVELGDVARAAEGPLDRARAAQICTEVGDVRAVLDLIEQRAAEAAR